jgi:uncharacterized iron-regulated protein
MPTSGTIDKQAIELQRSIS